MFDLKPLCSPIQALLFNLFISFVRPKEMNQRKGRRKCQLLTKRAPAAPALMALPFCQKFAPFPVCPRAVT